MSYPLPDREPDLSCGPLKVWILGRQFPDASDYWDGNWLKVVAHIAEGCASVTAGGPILHLGEISHWRDALAKMAEVLGGTAELPTIEPNLRPELACDHLGHVHVKCELTADHMTQRHSFSFQMDQTYLRPLVHECDEVLKTYRIRDPQMAQE